MSKKSPQSDMLEEKLYSNEQFEKQENTASGGSQSALLGDKGEALFYEVLALALDLSCFCK